MGLNSDMLKSYNVKDVRRVQYFDRRYYAVTYEAPGAKGKKRLLMNEKLVSVTEILGVLVPPFLMTWRGDVGNDRADQIMGEAMKLGSFVHYGADTMATGRGVVIFNPIEHPNFEEPEIAALEKKHKRVVIARHQAEYVQLLRIQQFLHAVAPRKVEAEQTIFSIQHKYAGTLDGFGWIDEGDYSISGSKPLHLESGWYVWDYKTGKSISVKNRQQISAYIRAVLEARPELRDDFRGGLLLHTNASKVEDGIRGFKAHLVDMKEVGARFQEFLKIFEVYKIEHPQPTPEEFEMPIILSYAEPKKGARR